jgi:SPP1 gp7 family putative phage head morphogenesis protein
LKGKNQDLQNKLHESLSEGIKHRETMKQLSNRVTEIFKDKEGFEAERVAMTEQTKIREIAKYYAYKESGLRWDKTWRATHDDRTSDLCKSLDMQKRDIDLPFETPNGKQFMFPPAHPMCRSVIDYTLNPKK